MTSLAWTEPEANRPELREYQDDVIERLRRRIADGQRRPLLVAPTGAGKTIIASAVVRAALDKGSRILFLAHRRELIRQAHEKLFMYGIDAGIIQAGFPARPDQPVQVASIQSLWSRAYRSSAIEKPRADLIVIDEAHRARANTYQRIVEDYPDAAVLGLTATPCRGDGRGLGNLFDVIVECPSVQKLIDAGYLVPTKVYAPYVPDLTGVTVQAGDYVERELAERMDKPELTGDVVTHWLKLAEGRKTVVFASGIEHSVHLRDEFCRQGVLAEHIDGSTPKDERDAILRRLSQGKIDVVTNCMVLTEGWDQPDVSCVVLARPTKHHGLYRQMVGRVLRPAEGKTDALVLDHSGAVFQHGFVEEPVRWTLREDKRAEIPRQKARSEGRMPALTTCPECHAVRMEGQPCVVCGWRPRTRASSPDVADGELVFVGRDRKAKKKKASASEQERFYAQLIYIAEKRGYRQGWAYYKFQEKFKQKPPWRKPDPIPPDPSVISWVRSRQIAFAKGWSK